jgi:hypothetical protein
MANLKTCRSLVEQVKDILKKHYTKPCNTNLALGVVDLPLHHCCLFTTTFLFLLGSLRTMPLHLRNQICGPRAHLEL